MRVTFNMFPDRLVNQLGLLAQRQSQLQTRAATGQKVQFPEDDPSAMRRALDLQNETSTLAQYKDNIARLEDLGTASYSAIHALKKLSDRAGEIATLADGTKSPQEMQAYAAEITQLIKQAAQLVNTRHEGNYLFGGTRSDQAPFGLATDANGLPTAVTYQGNAAVAEVEIAEGVTISSQVLGANTTGGGPRGLVADSRTGADFFAHLISLQDHLLAGDTNAIQSGDRASLEADEENFIFHIATHGSIQSRLQAASAVAADRAASIDTLMSNEVDADLAQTLVRLNEIQNAYMAALQSGGRVLSQSLLNYLR